MAEHTPAWDPRRAAGMKLSKWSSRRYGARPVRWLAVPQLLSTVVEVVLAAIFAKFADKREAMVALPAELYALTGSDEQGKVTVDYTADTGDGFDATFAVARNLRQYPADLLVLGGDQVYPTASPKAYLERFDRPFRAATLASEGTVDDRTLHRPVVALPGNHDWYDGLTSFRRLFCESWTAVEPILDEPLPGGLSIVKIGQRERADHEYMRRTRHRDTVGGGWVTAQTRSYFAVRVRPGWWLWGVDSQLNAQVDAGQLDYFRRAAAALHPKDGLVICTATPAWLEADGKVPPSFKHETPLQVLTRFLRLILGRDDDRVRLLLTGDQHHFAHYQPDLTTWAESPSQLRLATNLESQNIPDPTTDPPPPDDGPIPMTERHGPVLITAGGGGAFTSSTHHLPKTLTVPWGVQDGHTLTTHYSLERTYPQASQSRRLARRQLPLIGLRNGISFPLLIGGTLTAVFAVLSGRNELSISPALVAVVFVILAMTSGFAFTGRPKKRLRWLFPVLGLLHAAGLLLLLGGWWLLRRELSTEDAPGLAGYVITLLALAVGGTIVVTGYLWLADLVGYHGTEIYGGIRSERYKCYVRLRFEASVVRVTAFGIEKPLSISRMDDDHQAISEARQIGPELWIPRDPGQAHRPHDRRASCYSCRRREASG